MILNIYVKYGQIVELENNLKIGGFKVSEQFKVITLCGSTKFRKEFEEAQKHLTLLGNIVISVGLFGHEFGLDMNGTHKKMLDKMHFRKIDMSDEIFVVNPGGYVGLSTCDEIFYAFAHNKKVVWLEEPIECLFNTCKELNLIK